MNKLSQTFYYKLLERLEWTLLAAGAGIVLLLLGVGMPAFVPQEGSVSATSWLKVLTGSATGQPTFYTPLSQVIFVVLGIISLIFAVMIYRTTSAIIKIDDEAITYQKGGQIERVPWSEVTDVKKRVIAWRYGAGDIFTIATETDPYKITFKSTISGFPDLLEAIKTHTKIDVGTL
jgi:hypothetical protein